MTRIRILKVDFFHVSVDTLHTLAQASPKIDRLTLVACRAKIFKDYFQVRFPHLTDLRIKSWGANNKKKTLPTSSAVEHIEVDEASDSLFENFPNLKSIKTDHFSISRSTTLLPSSQWKVIIEQEDGQQKPYYRLVLEFWMYRPNFDLFIKYFAEQKYDLKFPLRTDRYHKPIYPIFYAMMRSRELFELLLDDQIDIFLNDLELALYCCYNNQSDQSDVWLSLIWKRIKNEDQRLKLIFLCIYVQFEYLDYTLSQPECKKILTTHASEIYQKIAIHYKRKIKLEDFVQIAPIPHDPCLYTLAMQNDNSFMVKALLRCRHPFTAEHVEKSIDCNGYLFFDFINAAQGIPELPNPDLQSLYHKLLRRGRVKEAEKLLEKDESLTVLFPDKKDVTPFEMVYSSHPDFAAKILAKARRKGFNLAFVKNKRARSDNDE